MDKNFESDVATDSEYKESCVNLTREVMGGNLAVGIAGMICFFFMLLTLVLAAFYICQYKTTFLQRLFFYLIVAATLAEGVFSLALSSALNNSNDYICIVVYQIVLVLQYYVFIVELMLVGSINLTILSKMYQYRASRPSQRPSTEYMLCCCSYKRGKEFIFVFIVFVFMLLCPAMVIILLQLENWQWPSQATSFLNIFSYVAFWSTVTVWFTDLLLTIISIVALAFWLLKLRRNNLLNNRMKLVCREMTFIISFLAGFVSVFIILFLLTFSFLFSQQSLLIMRYGSSLFPLIHVILPILFLVYSCTIIKQRRTPASSNSETVPPTAPPSTRVSLPSDTAAHAPNFLSPSTAELTEETSLLIKNE